MDNIIDLIIQRHKKLANPCYLNIFSADDRKKEKNIYSQSYDLHKKEIGFIKNELEIHNLLTYGVFFNFNLLGHPQRKGTNISKILYVFIDLDDANEGHNEIIKDNLKKKGLSYCYNAKSGHGYHFLIPISLDSSNKDKIKGFLSYLKNNVCDKVDVATHTNERLIRSPGSLHNKDQESKKLITLHTHKPTDKEIEFNTTQVLLLQEKTIKGIKDIQYQKSLKKEDIFFNTILNSSKKWKEYYCILNKSQDRNPNFIKNLGLFIASNAPLYERMSMFLEGWEAARIKAVEGWAKKHKEENMNVNYYELLKWAKDNKIKEWVLLLEEQVNNSFLDEYEFYYLEDEKSENNCLLYYPEKNYYLQKSISEVILNIYYDCKERGLDLVKELSLKEFYEKWDSFSFKKQITLIQDQLRRIIETENRMKLVFNINYEPSDLKFIHFLGKKYFNTYTKTSTWDYYKKQKNYFFPTVKELILNLCGNDIKSYNYLNNWISWQLTNPISKLPTAIIFQGRQGSGKGTFKELILDKIFGENCQEINQTHLESSFNEYLLGKQIIIANEVMHNDNRQTLPNVLKNLVTDPEITISRKFRREIKGKNYTHWIFCTNSDNPIKIDPDDRRYSVFYSEKIRSGLGKEIRENIDHEINEYVSYLKELSPIFEEVSEPLMTEAKAEIIDLNKDSVQKFKEYLQQFGTFHEAYSSITPSNIGYFIDESFGDGEKYILTEKVYLLYENWCIQKKERAVFAKQNFGKKLSNNGCKSLSKRKKQNVFRMYKISDLEKLMEPEDAQ